MGGGEATGRGRIVGNAGFCATAAGVVDCGSALCACPTSDLGAGCKVGMGILTDICPLGLTRWPAGCRVGILGSASEGLETTRLWAAGIRDLLGAVIIVNFPGIGDRTGAEQAAVKTVPDVLLVV